MNSPTILRLSSQDLPQFQEVILLFAQVFEREPFQLPAPAHLQAVLAKPGFHVFVAVQGHQVIGGLTAYTLDQYYSPKPLAFIYDVAVATTHQRQGIGKQLMAALQAFCQAHNYEEAFVPAETIDAHALEFYRSTQPSSEMQVVHFNYTFSGSPHQEDHP
ncbi:MAG: GNAT family N-acetyltransferase [Bacteroidota bacterium]